MSIWGGFIETLEECTENQNIPDNIKYLKKKLKLLEDAKTIEEVKSNYGFIKEERDFLMSPLLDEIYETIFFENPLTRAIEKTKIKAAEFYISKGVLSYFSQEIQECYSSIVKDWNSCSSYFDNVKKKILFSLGSREINILQTYLSDQYKDQYKPFIKFLIKNHIVNTLCIKNICGWANSEEIVEKFLERDLDKVREKDELYFESCLANAFYAGNYKIVDILLKHNVTSIKKLAKSSLCKKDILMLNFKLAKIKRNVKIYKKERGL